MLQRERNSSLAGVIPSRPPQPQRRPVSAERGRPRLLGAQITETAPSKTSTARVTPSPLYRQRSYSARSRGTLSGGRSTGNTTGVRSAGRGAGVLSPTERRVTFLEGKAKEEVMAYEDGRSRGGMLYTMPSQSIGNPVRHLLLELVEISQTLAAYLQDTSMRTSDGSPHNIGGVVTSRQEQQHFTLKTQEIERIVRRVESHFVEKITAMEQNEREQAAEIAGLKKEILRLSQGEGRTVSSATFLNRALAYQVPSDEKHDEVYRGSGNNISSAINNTGESEIEFLRQKLQEEKRQRLFVEEQTQSLTEQHGRVVGTLERRLQKQEDQLRDLTASLEHHQYQQQQQHSSIASPNMESPSLGTSVTPRRLIRQKLTQHEQTQRALEAYHHAFTGGREETVWECNGNTADGKSHTMNVTDENKKKKYHRDEDNIHEKDIPFGEFVFANTKAIPDGVGKSPDASHASPYLSSTNLQSFSDKPHWNQHHSVNGVSAVVDASSPRAAVKIDDIAAFLDNITQELEDIDVIESEREMKLSAAIKGL